MKLWKSHNHTKLGGLPLERFWAFLFVNSLPWLLVLAPFLAARGRKPWSWETVAGLEYRWQGLIAGALTVQAAIIGGYFIYQQIRRDIRTEHEAQNRRFQAELAVLPMILSDLIDHLEASARSANDLLGKVRSVCATKQPPRPVRLSESIVQQLKSLVENSDSTVTQSVQILLRKLQIHGSRMADLSRSHSFPGYSPPGSAEILNVLADTAELHAIVEHLFPFARGEVKKAVTDVSVGDIHGSSFKMFSNGPEVDGLRETIDRRHPR